MEGEWIHMRYCCIYNLGGRKHRTGGRYTHPSCKIENVFCVSWVRVYAVTFYGVMMYWRVIHSEVVSYIFSTRLSVYMEVNLLYIVLNWVITYANSFVALLFHSVISNT